MKTFIIFLDFVWVTHNFSLSRAVSNKKLFIVDFRRLKQGCQMVYAFAYQKSPFGYIFMALGMEYVGIFTVHLLYFATIWCV
jgi:hypothetical protein